MTSDAHPTAAERRLTAAQAAARLGVKLATLYAYVSRGLLHPVRGPDGRSSRFDPAEVARLAARGRRAAAPAGGPLIETALVTIADGELFYRGLPAVLLARERSFEEAAEWLWSGAFPARAAWTADPDAIALGRAVQAPLPPATPPAARLHLVAAALSAHDAAAGRGQPSPANLLPSARATARTLLVTLVESLPPASDAAPLLPPRPHEPFAARLWTRLAGGPPPGGALGVLGSALVLLADHEPSAATLAARAAARTGADLAAVVAAALAVAGTGAEVSAPRAAEALLAHVSDAAAAEGARLLAGAAVPALFGHPLHPDGDPRATALLDAMRAHLPPDRLAPVETLLALARARGLPPPNVDVAVAALARAAGMGRDAPEAIVCVARAAGWIAHALEEYAHAAPIRPRLLYTGPAPR
jgi:citrate synthase